jgi:hypothetical protein
MSVPDPSVVDWVPLWNLGSGPTIPPVVNGQWLKGVGGAAVWAAITPADVGVPKLTASAITGGPPASPANGDIWHALSVDNADQRWAFQYNQFSGSAYKWEFIGGPSLYTTSGTQSPAVGGWTTLSAALTMQRAGDYMFWCEAAGNFGAGSGGEFILGSQSGVWSRMFCTANAYGFGYAHYKLTVAVGQVVRPEIYLTAACTINLSAIGAVPIRVS